MPGYPSRPGLTRAPEIKSSEKEPDEAQGGAKEAESRKPYVPPRLEVHGSVDDVTEADSSNPVSDREQKTDLAPADLEDVLERLARVPVESWTYKSQDPAGRHIGPMAQDFAAAFGLGDSDRRIQTVDAQGVAFAAIQALRLRLESRDQELRQLREELTRLNDRLAAVEHDTASASKPVLET